MAIFKDSYPQRQTSEHAAGYNEKNIFVNRFCTAKNHIVENRWIDFLFSVEWHGHKRSVAIWLSLFLLQYRDITAVVVSSI